MKKIYLLLMLLLTTASAALKAQELPCKAKYNNERCAERYLEDSNGNKHGKYISYDEYGDVTSVGNYVHGKKQGNWFESGAFPRWYYREDEIYVWFENDKRFAKSKTPIASLAEAKSILQNEKDEEQKALEAKQKALEAKAKADAKADAEAEAVYEKEKNERLAKLEQERLQWIKESAEQREKELAEKEAARLAELKKLPVISPDLIRFNYDSYIPTQSTYNRLKEIGDRINQYNDNNPENKIKDVYIITHSNKAANNNSSDLKRQESVLFYVSLNRAVVISSVLATKAKDVKFHLLPVSSMIPVADDDPSKNIRADILFEDNQYVQNAKSAFGQLSRKYKVAKTNDEFATPQILPNYELRKDVIHNVKQYVAAQDNNPGRNITDRFIPLELWIDEYGKNEEGLQNFKMKLIKIAGSEKRVNQFMYKPIL